MAQSTRYDTSVDIKALEKTITDNQGGGSSSSVDTRCIYRVPEVLRRNNTKAYQPDMVAIGPLHDRKQKQYQHMEQAKGWYLGECILASKDVGLAQLIEVVKKVEKPARECYAESLDYINSNDFCHMMILDGCFIIELFRRFTRKKRKVSDDVSQPKGNDPLTDSMIQYICHDLLLLENQLPWVVLQSLYSLTQGTLDGIHDLSLSELIFGVFTFLPSLRNNCMAYLNYLYSRYDQNDDNHKHILDLVRTSIVYSFEPVPSHSFEPVPSHDCVTRCLQRAKKEEEYDGPKFIGDEFPEILSATTLSKGGVKFKRGFHGGQSMMSMGFEAGVWRIPLLVIGETTGTLFRNLIAFEQCSQSQPHLPHLITSYAFVMDKLISSKKDIEFLCEEKIIQNWLSAEVGFEFFNNIYNDTMLDNFYYRELCSRVNIYYNRKCVRWIENLKREYFQTPWTIISLFAAAILLGLTLVQTIFTVHG